MAAALVEGGGGVSCCFDARGQSADATVTVTAQKEVVAAKYREEDFGAVGVAKTAIACGVVHFVSEEGDPNADLAVPEVVEVFQQTDLLKLCQSLASCKTAKASTGIQVGSLLGFKESVSNGKSQ